MDYVRDFNVENQIMDYRELRGIVNSTHKRFSQLNFDQSLSLPQKVNLLAEHFKTVLINFQELVDYLDWFIENFDEKLYKTLEEVLKEWLDSGKFEHLINQIVTKIGDLDEFRPWDKTLIEKIKNEFNGQYLNIEWFGAKGDGVTDNSDAIQTAVDFGRILNNQAVVFVPDGDFITKKPILLYGFKQDENDTRSQWWFGNGTKLVGNNLSRSRIIKKGCVITENLPNELNNKKDSTFVCVALDENGEITGGQQTGVSISNLSCHNESIVLESTVITGRSAQRAEFDKLNIVGNGGGIDFYDSFSSSFTNLVITTKRDGCKVLGGTSNRIENVYTFGTQKPYHINSVYSHVNLIYADDCTDVIFNLGGRNLSVGTIGCESPNAKTILSVTGYITVDSLFFTRQNENYAPILLNGTLDIRLITVSEHKQLSEDTKVPLFSYSNKGSQSEYKLGNIQYSVNTPKPNPRFYLSTDISDRPAMDTTSSLSIGGNNIGLRRGNTQAYLGFRKHDSLNFGDLKPKAIYLDNKTIFETSQENVEWQKAYNYDDVLLMNNPKETGIFASVVTEVLNESVNGNRFKYVQIISNERERPIVKEIGFMHFDRKLGKPIWWNGNGWVGSDGVVI